MANKDPKTTEASKQETDEKPVYRKGEGDVLECPNCHAPEEIGVVWDSIKEIRANQAATSERTADIDKRVSEMAKIDEKLELMGKMIREKFDRLDRALPVEEVEYESEESAGEEKEFTSSNED